MYPMLTAETTATMISPIVVAIITIVPATLSAWWARKAKKNSEEAKANSAGALHEVKANGGMSDPDPTLKDYIKYVGENVEQQSRRLNQLEAAFESHLAHSRLMDSVLARVFEKVIPDTEDPEVKNLIN